LQQLVLELKRALRDSARKAAKKAAEISTTCVFNSFNVVFQSYQLSLLECLKKLRK